MIPLRDRYTTRATGEAWLFAGDALAAASAVLFVAGALGSQTALLDASVIALWSILPRGLGRVLDSMLLGPRTLLRNLAIAAAIGCSERRSAAPASRATCCAENSSSSRWLSRVA